MLTAIGALPHLELLDLEEDPEFVPLFGPESSTTVELPHGSFPVLQKLVIYVHKRFELVERIWNIATLVRRLTSVSLCVKPPVDYAQACDLVRNIHQGSPLVRDLILDFRHIWRHLGLLKTGFAALLSQFPLQRLYFAEQYNIQDGQRCTGQELALALPNVEHLQLYGYNFTFQDLTFIAAHMPRLETLSISIKVGADWPSMDDIPLPSLKPSSSQLLFHFPNSPSISTLSKSKDPSVVERIAV
ncbi:unnamed protein product [Rhizoctonia solani]|uniref:Uncharacterized protein n=1 Tax=Rhizoctonia solani TaxID=456999 RepID=A0A8H2WAY2_9AGAM|nr:unnamed protein product [Rhizoctonia solani]